MKKFIQTIKEILSSTDGLLSSKRLCGVIGWISVINVLLYCTMHSLQAPLMIDTFMVCCMGLLGIDSITGIWKKGYGKGEK